MTDVQDRVGAGAPESPGRIESTTPGLVDVDLVDDRQASFELALPGRVLVATLAGSVSLLGFTLLASHLSDSRVQALVLTVMAWLQLAIAVLVMVRPSRRLLRRSIVLNLVVVAAFALSHTVGVRGGAHDAAATSQASVGALLALGLISAAILALVRPALGRDWDNTSLVLATLVPVSVLSLTTAAVAMSDDSRAGNAGAVDVSVGDPGAAPTTTSVATAPKLADGESAENAPDVPLDPTAQKQLADQLVLARAAALQYPTVADAKLAGMVLAGGMAPGVGAHYEHLDQSALNGVKADGTVDPSLPSSFIYSGTSDDSPMVGVMYTTLADTQPEGFAGPNDHWHRHSNLCIKFVDGTIDVPVAPDSDVTKEQCDGLGGQFMAKTVWMVHAWVVPGWESPKGVFSHDNPNLHCPGPLNADGTERVDSIGFCIQQ